MKIVIRTVVFHFMCILIFALFYYYFGDGFRTQENKKSSILDYIFLSTTIQSGVGLTDIFPIYNYNKLIMIIQQLLMIMTHVFTLYVFTL